MNKQKSLRITESAIMLAFATILSMIAIVQLPFGGSITAFSMLPILLIAYRHGTPWGLFTALAFSLLQMLLGMNNLSYATSTAAVFAIIFLDYIFAFLVLGLGGIFRKVIPNQAGALTLGTLLACSLRYVSHVISGCTVWAGVSIPSSDGLIYSLAYNATYMIPETLVTIVGVVYLSKVLDFRSETITRTLPQQKSPDLAILLSGLAKTFVAIVAVYDIQKVFSALQKEEGGFDITQLSTVNWTSFILITAIGLTIAFVLWFVSKKIPSTNSCNLQPVFRILPYIAVAAAAVFDVIYIVMAFQEGPVSGNTWIQIGIITISVIAAAFFLIVRGRAKRQA